MIVTGGIGFIGSRLVKRLNESGHSDITIVDRPKDHSGLANLHDLKYTSIVDADEFIESINQPKEVPKAIFHLGACSSTAEMDIDYLKKNNVEYSITLAKYCHKHNVPFIYASSAATYGSGTLGFVDDESKIPTLKPLNPYGVSKQMFDEWILKFTKDNPSNWKWYGLKYFNVFGPHECHKGEMKSLVCKAHEQIKKTGALKLFKSANPEYQDGHQSRDFIYVGDTTKITQHFFEQRESAKVGIYNVGTGEARTFLDLGRSVFKSMNVDENIQWIPTPEKFVKQYQYFTQADVTKLRQDGGFKDSFTSIESGVDDYINSYFV